MLELYPEKKEPIKIEIIDPYPAWVEALKVFLFFYGGSVAMFFCRIFRQRTIDIYGFRYRLLYIRGWLEVSGSVRKIYRYIWLCIFL